MTESLFPGALARRARGAELSPIAAAGARAARLAAQGRSIIVLTSGEPDFDTPAPIKAAAIAALEEGKTKYTPTAGTAALRRAVADGYRQRHGLDVDASNVIISNGGKQVIYLALNATLDEGDEVIVPAPYWPTFPDAVRINGGVPVVVRTSAEDGFKLTPAALRDAITPRTKWLILNSPGNPSGAVYRAEELQALAEVLRDAPQVLVLWDEMYEEIWFGQPPAHLLREAPDLAGRVLVVNGVSKAYAMTGWRIGWGTGPQALIHALEAVQSQVSSGPSSLGQAAALAALQGAADGFVEAARLAYARRAQRVAEGLGAVPGLQVHAPQGSFFAWIGVSGLTGRRRPDGRPIAHDGDVVDWLLESEGVAVVRGAAYGLSPYLRLSFAASDANIEAAIERIGKAVAALSPARELEAAA
ncbi:aminotransferase class I/II-fold pyridoxal phosphate-dependent enzyme [Achromobacter deleyi]|uniref:aminotransferase class I/II-fold pyridoxal phosphate-dependent enzyme n=1 Tax=Achromobacter deleyi TaxID=1353891 RepID=UPI0014919019|nr:aminotransferase class I/II-fold pyridoxal phosphate-dependent enzyme [Achromobacter deleyi]QVQ28416.1 aminotransferase class I/II-fold pyridoxal phosphate-dependent enzyme [Achromobacter deleyi]UIP18519.1 aminotransferase class I/II-fold pyridoxal phosphate-dependent enzyme [Achromobacter deleyi]